MCTDLINEISKMLACPKNWAAYLLPRLQPDAEVLDVGCGPGTITVGLAERVPDGTVVGVDAEPTIVEQARSTSGASDAANLSFEVGDVYDLAVASRRSTERFTRSAGGEPDAGRHLGAWAHVAGFFRVEVSASM